MDAHRQGRIAREAPDDRVLFDVGRGAIPGLKNHLSTVDDFNVSVRYRQLCVSYRGQHRAHQRLEGAEVPIRTKPLKNSTLKG